MKLRHWFRRATNPSAVSEEQRNDFLGSTSLSTKYKNSAAMLKGILRLAKPFWTSKENRRNWLLLGSMVALSFGQVALNVQFNNFNQDFTNALTKYNAPETWNQIKWFCELASVWIAATVYKQYLTQKLQMNWRKAMTNDHIDKWIDGRTFYHMENSEKKADNPDQRIADDINRFTNSVLTLGVGLLKTGTSLASFSTILWHKSGALDFTVAGHALHIPGYMVAAAVLYAGVGTGITHLIGKKLSGLNNDQQKFEADFRYSAVRLRENAKQIAIAGGEGVEKGVLRERFNRVVDNYWSIIKKQKELTWFTSGYAQLANIFPLLPLFPKYFAKQLDYGQMMSTAGAFGTVQDDLSWFISAYTDLAELSSVTQRLEGFNNTTDEIRKITPAPEVV